MADYWHIGKLKSTLTDLRVGFDGNGFTSYFLGKIYRATISNSIGGAPVVNFDANEFNAATSQSSWTSSTGEVWSIQKDQLNNSAFSGQMVNRTIIVGSGTTYMTGDAGLRGTQDFSVFHCSNSDINAGSPSAGTVFGNYIAGNLQVLTDGKASALYIGLYLNAAEYTTQTQVQNAIYVMGFQRTSGAYTIDYNGNQVKTGTNSQTIGTTSNFRIFQNTSGGEGLKGRLCGMVVVKIGSTPTQRTALYSYIKQISKI